jgi:hypothetical protein
MLALALCLSLVPSAFAAPVGGGGCQATDLPADMVDIYTVSFRAGETAYVTIDGDGDTDLDVFVYDENGNLITFDTGLGDNAVLAFTPLWTGTFTIEVVNNGVVSNQYTICMV